MNKLSGLTAFRGMGLQTLLLAFALGLILSGTMPVLGQIPSRQMLEKQEPSQILVFKTNQSRYLPDASHIELYRNTTENDSLPSNLLPNNPPRVENMRRQDLLNFFSILSASDSARKAILFQPVQWVRFQLVNRDSVHTRFVLSSPADSTVSYLLTTGTVDGNSITGNATAGYKTAMLLAIEGQNEPFGLDGMFRLEVPYGDTAWVYLRLEYTSMVSRQLARDRLPAVKIYPETLYQQRYTVHLIRHALFYGAMLVMMLYHLFVFVKTRTRTYLLFSIFILGLCLFMASNAGYLMALGLQSVAWLNSYIQFCSAPLTLLAYLLFCRDYLQPSIEQLSGGILSEQHQDKGYLSEKHPSNPHAKRFQLLRRIHVGLIIWCLVVVTTVLLGYWSTGRMMAIWLTLVVMGFILYASIQAARVAYKPARYFVAANSLFLVSALVFSTQQFWGPSSVWASYGLQIGSVALISVLSLGLISRINWVGKQVLIQAERNRQLEKAAARERELLIYQKNQELEERILERTAQITEQNEEIQAQNSHLAQMNEQLLSLQERINSQNQILANTNHQLESLVEQRTQTLQQTLTQLEQTLHELDTFLYRTSHDMRAPLASVLGLVELSQGETNPDEKENYLVLIDRSVRRLDKLLVDINQYAKNKKLTVQVQPIVFTELIEQLVEGLKFAKNAQHVTFQWNITQEGDFYGDIQRISSVIGNLLSNAVRYHSTDRLPVITITGQVTDMANIVIADNGIGIEKEFQNRIFEMFFRLSYQSEGSGLGLYIVKQTLTTMGGSIGVKSTLGQGTSFTITIPSLVSTV